MAQGKIFISHTHSDIDLVTALHAMIKAVFGDHVVVSHSSSKELDGGIRSGEDWYQWIVKQVSECQVALVLLTPASAQKPWILWESGAVYGAAEALRKGSDIAAKVRPLVYQLASDEVPSPLQRSQTLNGLLRVDMEKLLRELLNDFRDLLTFEDAVKAGGMLGTVAAVYLEAAITALKDAPLTVTEAAVQEWLGRLDDLDSQRRLSEVEHVHEWLRVAFGRDLDKKDPLRGDRATQERPVDLRIHRRLGELYQAAGKPKKAATEFRLAERLAPRDLFLLRRLGKALLDDNDREGARAVLDRIAGLDAHAFTTNQECAALKGRYLVEGGNFSEAAATYQAAHDRNPDSYYLVELLAQAHLRAGKRQEAANAYQAAVAIVDRLGERNIWTHATAAMAAIVADNMGEASAQLHKIRDFRPPPSKDNLMSIEKGLTLVQQSLKLNDACLVRWREQLRG